MKKKIIISIFSIVLLIVALISMTSCSKKENITYYTVTFNSNGGSEVESQKIGI